MESSEDINITIENEGVIGTPELETPSKSQEVKDENAEHPQRVEIDTPPSDIRYLTIKNLDTGEEFIIGENDPDFEFNTFEIGRNLEPEMKEDTTEKIEVKDEKTNEIDIKSQEPSTPTTPQDSKTQRVSWWRSFFGILYGSRHSTEKLEEKADRATTQESQSEENRSKTPFTKLSSFKFRKELGRGAFGRVLLAEAKTDNKLYALKIISKKNMRSSDKRQAKAERDILYCMTLKAPHPFTSGLKFAFQSENNLYLGMDYIPGGNLRELIKKFKYLPEVK